MISTVEQVRERLQTLAANEGYGVEARQVLAGVTATTPTSFLDEAHEKATAAGYGYEAARIVNQVRGELATPASAGDATGKAVLDRLRALVNEQVPAFNRPTAEALLKQVADEFGITAHEAQELAEQVCEANGWNHNAVDAFLAGWDAHKAQATA